MAKNAKAVNQNQPNIWLLFSMDNNYDQPPNNLVAWWENKPSFNELSKALGWSGFPCQTDEGTLAIVNLWQGQEIRPDPTGTRYWMKNLNEGKIDEER